MKDVDFAFAVARIRANENSLLSNAAASQLIAAPDLTDAIRVLQGRGYEIHGSNYDAALDKRAADCYDLMVEILPDIHELDAIIVKNDFNDLKVSLKAAYLDRRDVGRLFVRPTVFDPEQVDRLVRSEELDALPEELREAAKSGWAALSETGFAQVADTAVDKYCLKTMLDMAKKAFDPFVYKVTALDAAYCAIKAIYRCCLIKKPESFMRSAVPNPLCGELDTDALIKAAAKSRGDFFAELEHTAFSEAGAILKRSATDYEKYCADSILSLARENSKGAFGSAPVIAYYIAVCAEIRTLRIILGAKAAGTDNDVIRQRVRQLYV